MQNRRSELTHLFCLWLLLFMGLLAIGLIGNSPESIYFTNDAASTIAVADGALSGDLPLAGPPAARGGRHFGPWYFYWQTFFLALSGGDIEQAIVLETVGKCFFLTLGAIFSLVLLLRTTALSYAVFGAFLSFLSGSWWWVLRTPWHSNFVASLAWFLPVFIMTSFERGYVSPALLFLLCSLTIQSHLATAPLVLWAIGITTLFRILRRAKNPIEAPSSQHSILCWLFGVLSWVPTILYSIKFPDGLLGSEATTSNHAPREGIVRALYFTLKVMKRFLFGEAPWTDLLSPLGETSAISLLCVFALFAVSLLSQMKNSAPQTKWKGFSLLSLLLSYTLAIAVLRRPVHLHYENALVFLFPVLSGLLFHQAAMSLKSSVRPHWRYLSFGFLALFLLISFRAGASTLRVLRSKPFPSQTTVHHAKEFSEVLRELSFSADKDAMLINESEKYRESAPFVYLGRDFFPLMQYAKSFRELPEFRSSAGRSPERMLVVSCEGLPDRRVSKYLKNWKFDSEIDLHRCESCKGCTLRRWLKDSSAAVVPDRLGVEPSQRTLPEEETGQETERQLQD